MKLNGYQIVSESVQSSIDLEKFDKNFYLQHVPKKDQNKAAILSDDCIKHNIITNIGESEFVLGIVGFVGYIPTKKDPKIGFIQIYILPEYRGKGYLQLAEDKLAEIHKLKSLYATIDLDNKASLKGHLKAGFKYFPKSKINNWIKLGFMKDNQTRLYKNY